MSLVGGKHHSQLHVQAGQPGHRRPCMTDVSSSEKLIYSIICICLVLIGGVMSGLTLGLMSLDVVDLEVSPPASLQLVLLQSLQFALGGKTFVRHRCDHYCKSCLCDPNGPMWAAGFSPQWHPK